MVNKEQEDKRIVESKDASKETDSSINSNPPPDNDKNESAWELFKEKLRAANWEYMDIEGFVNELKQSFSLSSLPKET